MIIQYLSGRRRGKRLEFAPGQLVRFGRHPCSEVAFHPRRDLVTSSHHAELRWQDGQARLHDVGSSNGVFVAGEPVTEIALARDRPILVEFGAGGPCLRIVLGNSSNLPPLPDFSRPYARIGMAYPVAFGIAMAVVVALSILAWILLV